MSVNYTEEQVKEMVAQYSENPTRETVEELAEEFNKSIKSIIGKLSREGVYEKTVYKTKTGEDPITKKELVEELSELVGIEYSMISGLEKSPKIDLKRLVDILKEE
jgi:N-methylhydantoinase B/oxoprolinase/acetone carboxylase alpha subunit|tara:strand:+ start:74 stop:391 length:318 start_codon:yes stop_codon:yes gene_type:complete